MTTSTRTAACSCGQLSLLVRGDPLRVSICHCLACQRRTGSVFGAQTRFALEQVTVSGRSQSWTRISDDGNPVVHHFCPTCGNTVYYAVGGYDDGRMAIPVGAFADPGFPPPRVSVYEERMHAWVHLQGPMEHLR